MSVLTAKSITHLTFVDQVCRRTFWQISLLSMQFFRYAARDLDRLGMRKSIRGISPPCTSWPYRFNHACTILYLARLSILTSNTLDVLVNPFLIAERTHEAGQMTESVSRRKLIRLTAVAKIPQIVIDSGTRYIK